MRAELGEQRGLAAEVGDHVRRDRGRAGVRDGLRAPSLGFVRIAVSETDRGTEHDGDYSGVNCEVSERLYEAAVRPSPGSASVSDAGGPTAKLAPLLAPTLARSCAAREKPAADSPSSFALVHDGEIHRVGPDFGSTLTVSNRNSQSNCWVN